MQCACLQCVGSCYREIPRIYRPRDNEKRIYAPDSTERKDRTLTAARNTERKLTPNYETKERESEKQQNLCHTETDQYGGSQVQSR